MLLSLAITVCVVAWGYLVLAAIDFGSTARGGESMAWLFLALACVGAAACLFTGMILIGRLLRAAGIITEPASAPGDDPTTVPGEPWPGTTPARPATANGSAGGARTGAPVGTATSKDPTKPAASLPAVPTQRRQGGKRAAR